MEENIYEIDAPITILLDGKEETFNDGYEALEVLKSLVFGFDKDIDFCKSKIKKAENEISATKGKKKKAKLESKKEDYERRLIWLNKDYLPLEIETTKLELLRVSKSLHGYKESIKTYEELLHDETDSVKAREYGETILSFEEELAKYSRSKKELTAKATKLKKEEKAANKKFKEVFGANN